jgi:regulator of nucleoside diphosphate kinase
MQLLPEIAITPRDLARLDLLTGFVVTYRTPVRETLARELRRARVVPAHALPLQTVTMHSTATCREDGDASPRTVTLVYPGEESREEGKLSVLTPLGAALIGLSAGQSIGYEDPAGRARSVTVLAVHQAGKRREWRAP